MEVTEKKTEQVQRKRRYGFKVDGKTYYAEPTSADIAEAIQTGQLETRGLQQHSDELNEEWARVPVLEERATVVRQYHARRIARFVVDGWTDAISICVHDVLEDGAHRLLAARYKGDANIDCVVVKCNKCEMV